MKIWGVRVQVHKGVAAVGIMAALWNKIADLGATKGSGSSHCFRPETVDRDLGRIRKPRPHRFPGWSDSFKDCCPIGIPVGCCLLTFNDMTYFRKESLRDI